MWVDFFRVVTGPHLNDDAELGRHGAPLGLSKACQKVPNILWHTKRSIALFCLFLWHMRILQHR